jgi:hypothetical protein
MPRRHQDHQPVDLAALHALKVRRDKAVMRRGAVAWIPVLGEADQVLALRFELIDPRQIALERFLLGQLD